MRIIAGEAKGRRIRSCRGRELRPTADRVKETIFNLVGGKVLGARVLDLFAGSGSLGLESLSRGASRAIFADSSPSAVSAVRENIEALGFADKAEVIKTDVFKAIRDLRGRGEEFEIILADPPYDRGLGQKAVDLLSRFSLLSPGGTIIVEHSRREVIDCETFRVVREKAFGETVVSFLERKAR